MGTNTVKEKPILFSAPMVRAILDGRKTQTRRIVKMREIQNHTGNGLAKFCPYGMVGDHLWVRETHILSPKGFAGYGGASNNYNVFDDDGDGRICQYLATDPNTEGADIYGLKKRPSIYMPRWASRITLEITDVRVERLNEISESDSRSEGIDVGDYRSTFIGIACREHTIKFRELWELINGEGSWDANPWVWLIEFKVV